MAVSPYFTVLSGLNVDHKVFVVYGTYTHTPLSPQKKTTTTNEQEMLNENQWKCVRTLVASARPYQQCRLTLLCSVG